MRMQSRLMSAILLLTILPLLAFSHAQAVSEQPGVNLLTGGSGTYQGRGGRRTPSARTGRTTSASVGREGPARLRGREVGLNPGDITVHLVRGRSASVVSTLADNLGLRGVVIETATFTYRELAAASDAAAKLLYRGDSYRFSTEIDHESDVVRIHVNPAVAAFDDVKLELTSFAAFRGYVFDTDYEYVNADVCNVHACTPPIRGGVLIQGGGFTCSAGWVGRRNGAWSVLSAGHCGVRNWNTNNRGLGNTSVQERNWDALVIEITDPGYWAPTNAYYPRTNFDLSRVTTKSDLYGYGDNAVVCVSGGASGVSACGRIESPSTTGNIQGFINNDMFSYRLSSRCSQIGGGDSGGPIYNASKAYGIHSATTKDDTCRKLGTKLVRAENATGFRIFLG